MRTARMLPALALGALLAGCAGADGRTAEAPAPAERGPGAEAGAAESGAAEPAPRPDPVAPDPATGPATADSTDAGTREGLFHVRLSEGALRFGVPRETLGRDLLLVVRSIEGGGGGPTRVVRWERDGAHLLLRERSFEERADSGRAIHRAVERLSRGPIIARLPVESEGPDSVPVVDVTSLFTTPVPEMGGLENLQDDRTFVERAWAFPTNVEVEATQTARELGGGGAGGRATTRTARLHWSFLRLPEEPMRPRLHDERVGFLTSSWIDYGADAHAAERRRVIHRFRLEPADPEAVEAGGLTEPLQPIVFWIDPATPRWLVPWVRRGVEAWRPAFEEAGFRDAIVARPAPTPEEDPEWSMHDARHSVVHWRASPIANATGAHTVDPRSGEILKAEVRIHHDVMRLLRNWYWVQTGPLDPRNRSLPLPDSLMGRLVELVVTHEVGHALGLPHNTKSSSMYPVDSLRSETFLRRMGGHVASVMDYSRFNYVAQPEDRIPPELLVPSVGPYDRFAVRWAHRPIPGARTPEEERPTLDRWARAQDTVPWLRFPTPGAESDPGDLTEAVGDADAVRASELGLRNLERVVAMLVPVAERPGEGHGLLRELYDGVAAQWSRYMEHVAAVVGGARSREPYGRGVRFEPVEGVRQREAVAFLSRHAFRPPEMLLEPEVLRRLEEAGAVDRVRLAQVRVLRTLFAPGRLERLVEHEALAGPGADVYPLAELLADVRRGVWTEVLGAPSPVGVHRRNLQRSYLVVAEDLLHPPGGARAGAASDVRPLLRGELEELAERVEASLAAAPDRVSELHLRDVRAEIRRILEVDR